MRISDWSSDVCSSDLDRQGAQRRHRIDAMFGDLRDHRIRHAVFGIEEENRRRLRRARQPDAQALRHVALVQPILRHARTIDIDVDLRIADRKSTRLNYSHYCATHMPTSA